jgi:hypothetical protein
LLQKTLRKCFNIYFSMLYCIHLSCIIAVAIRSCDFHLLARYWAKLNTNVMIKDGEHYANKAPARLFRQLVSVHDLFSWFSYNERVSQLTKRQFQSHLATVEAVHHKFLLHNCKYQNTKCYASEVYLLDSSQREAESFR